MNESRTCAGGGTELTQVGSRPVRYRLIGPNGERYAPFRPHVGKLTKIMPEGDGWELETA